MWFRQGTAMMRDPLIMGGEAGLCLACLVHAVGLYDDPSAWCCIRCCQCNGHTVLRPKPSCSHSILNVASDWNAAEMSK